jgi:cytochrome c biogenesis protein CcmG/thiol:disulfide interchange protein DsbE
VKRLLPFAPLAVGALLVLLFAGYGLHHDPQVYPAAMVGKPLPKLALSPLQGGPPMRIAVALNGPGVVNLFQSTCAPCALESPQLMQLRRNGVTLIGVAWRDQPAATQGFLDRFGNPFGRVLQDPNGDAGIEFGISGVPESFIVDGQGMIVAKHIGAMTDRDVRNLTAQIEKLR